MEMNQQQIVLLSLMRIKDELDGMLLSDDDGKTGTSTWFIPSSERTVKADSLLRVVQAKSIDALQTYHSLTLQELPHPAEMQQLVAAAVLPQELRR